MADPSTTAAATIAVTTTGITVLGISLGLRPELLLAGLWGAFWALSYAEPTPLRRRCTLSATAAILAGYATPAAMAVLESASILQSAGAPEKLQYPVAVGFGFLSHRILGPFLMRFAAKKSSEIAP